MNDLMVSARIPTPVTLFVARVPSFTIAELPIDRFSMTVYVRRHGEVRMQRTTIASNVYAVIPCAEFAVRLFRRRPASCG